jgi:DNA modification methylase
MPMADNAAGAAPGWADSIMRMDCAEALAGLPAGSVDLCYLDPPYCTGRDFDAFDDRWANVETAEQAAAQHIIDAVNLMAGPDAAAYTSYLHLRLVEIHRVLKDSGSVFVHLDGRMSHCVRLCLDQIFGADRFLNEIVWHYGLGAFSARRRLPRKHDTILWYARSDTHTFQLQRGAVTEAMDARYNMADDKGRYFVQGAKRYYMRGGRPWDDVGTIPSISQTAKERTGYPTQKPLELLERVVSMASSEGDIVLDPFCGSGTTLVAARRLGRRFLGIDIGDEAVRVATRRLEALDQQGVQGRIDLPDACTHPAGSEAQTLPLDGSHLDTHPPSHEAFHASPSACGHGHEPRSDHQPRTPPPATNEGEITASHRATEPGAHDRAFASLRL